MAIGQSEIDSLARSTLFYFTWRAFNILYPSSEFIPAWHVRAMADALEQAFERDDKRLLITVPPRHLKSFLTSVALPAYLLGRDPGSQIMVASYGAELATTFGRQFRALVRSPGYARLFPGTKLDSKRSTDHEVRTTQNGCRLSVSPTAAATGFGADVLIIDDLVKASDASSAAKRQEAKSHYDEVLYSRLNNKSNGIVIAIQQRLHEDDLAAHLLAKGFTLLNLPAIAEQDEDFYLGEGRTHHRKKGEALFPEHEPLATLARIRREIGATAFGAQYQQNPVPPGGNMLQWHWFGTYEETPARHELLNVVQSWDTAHSEEPNANYSVCLTFGFQDNHWLLLDVWRQQVEYYKLKAKAFELQRRWQPDNIVIEMAGTGLALLYDMRERCERTRIWPYSPRIGKEERFAEQVALVEEGLVLIPQSALWKETFRKEMLAFPNGSNDDQVDAFAQFLDFVRRTHTVYGVRPLIRRNIIRREVVRRNIIRA